MAKKIYKRLDIHGAKSYSPKFENFTFPRKKISNSLVVFKNFKELQSLSIESCDWPMWLDLRWQMTNLLQWVHRITVSTVIILYVLSRWIIHILQYLTTLNFFFSTLNYSLIHVTRNSFWFFTIQSGTVRFAVGLFVKQLRSWPVSDEELLFFNIISDIDHQLYFLYWWFIINIITKNTASLLKLY